MKQTSINLLPGETSGVSEIARVQRILTRITYVVGTIFLVSGFGIGIYILILTTQISDANASVVSLKNDIQTKQKVEEQYVFVKERVDKVKAITAARVDVLSKFSEMAKSVPVDSAVSEGEIDEDKFDITYIIRNSADIVDFFTSFVGKGYSEVALKSFSFNPAIGYIVGLGMTLAK